MKSLPDQAREAGLAGVSWSEWTFGDEVQAAIDAHDGPRGRLIRECERAYAEGRRERLRATWATRWTTAPEDYDSFGTEAVGEAGEWCGKPLRQVVIDPHHLGYQAARYGSGNHGCWEEDPNVEAARLQAESEARRAEQAAREARQAEGKAWLAGLSDETLQAVSDGQHDAELDRFGIGCTAIRDERKKRQDAAAERERTEAWSKYRPMIPDGCVLVDDGDEGGYVVPAEERGYTFRRPRRDTHVHYDVHVSEVASDAERSTVYAGREPIGSVDDIAYQLGNGRLRVAAPCEVPPKKVLDRFGHDRLKEIRRLEIKGRVVWVGRRRFESCDMVLDENGRIVRAKAIVAEAKNQ